MKTETVKVFEEKKRLPTWMWLLPALLLALVLWLLNRRPQETTTATATPVTDQTKPGQEAGTHADSTWTAASIADSIRSQGRVGFNDNDVHFPKGSTALAGDSQAVLDQTAQALQANSDWRMRVVGHTDSIGSGAVNQQLAQHRASSVMAYLTAHGVNPSRLSTDAPCGTLGF